MNTKAENESLWKKIDGFSLDAAGASFPFSAKLAKENDWTPEYTARVIQEYKRFLFLSVTANHPVSPSDAVDQAWHLHILFTAHYQNFCDNVLGRAFHHFPAQGGGEKKAKFDEMYQQTLASYHQTFEEEPPEDIWPHHLQKIASRHRYVRIGKNSHWVIRKPKIFGGH